MEHKAIYDINTYIAININKYKAINDINTKLPYFLHFPGLEILKNQSFRNHLQLENGSI